MRNLHLEHIEDHMLLYGNEGLKAGMVALSSTLSALGGAYVPECQLIMSRKLDGAPAVVVGKDLPGIPGISLSTKSFFNKKPLYAQSEADIETIWGNKPSLVAKLKKLFALLPDLNIEPGTMLQGDILFTSDTLYTRRKDSVEFQANAISYICPIYNEDSHALLSDVEVCVAWHTGYLGDTLSEMSAFPVSHVTCKNPKLYCWPVAVEVVPKKSRYLENRLAAASHAFDRIYSPISQSGEIHEKIALMAGTHRDELRMLIGFINSNVKAGDQFPRELLKEFEEWALNNLRKHRDTRLETLKTPRGVESAHERYEDLVAGLRIFMGTYSDILTKIMELLIIVVEIKHLIVQFLDLSDTCRTYLRTTEGTYENTGHEGYVISSYDITVKLVNRSEFSKANFSHEYLKGWDK